MSTIRQEVWSLRNNPDERTTQIFEGLVKIAEEIALGADQYPEQPNDLEEANNKTEVGESDAPGAIQGLEALEKPICPTCPNQGCPKPINYLANGEPCSGPTDYGLAGLLDHDILGSSTCLAHPRAGTTVFNGCNFDVLEPLAIAKNPRVNLSPRDGWRRGFNTGGKRGLAILLGGWSDFCLWCWSHFGQDDGPILILGKDNSTLAGEQVYARRDWGANQVADVLNFPAAPDSSTRNLFGAIEQAAGINRLEQIVGGKRIFVFNVWPWFRCGTRASGYDGIHGNFVAVPGLVERVQELVNLLNPCKIATLGGWGYNEDAATLTTHMTGNSKTWFEEVFLTGTPFSCATAHNPCIRQFPHPAVWGNPVPPAWFADTPEYRGTSSSAQEAFRDFVSAGCPPVDKSRVLDQENLDE